MRTRNTLRSFCLLATVGLATANSQGQSKPALPVPAAGMPAKPLLLERNEGEARVRRIPANNVAMSVPASQFMLKVSPKNNGSQRLVLVTEELAPGAQIRRHRHFGQDEIVLVQTGTAHVRLGSEERTLHAGGLVFIPSDMSIELQNVGSEAISLVAIFSAPGFEDYMRCASVPGNQKPTTITREELEQCAHVGHVEYADLEATPRK